MENYSTSSLQYLKDHHVLTYLEDAISLLLKLKEDNPKLEPSLFLAEYFKCLKEGYHIFLREYSFVGATAYNRGCFVKLFHKCFANIGKKELLNVRDYSSLISLICTDFPNDILQKTARIILLDDATDCVMSFTDFLYAFQIQFYFEEFLERCSKVFDNLKSSRKTPRKIVVPTDHDNASSGQGGGAAPETSPITEAMIVSEGVEREVLLKALLTQITDSEGFSVPSSSVLKQILSQNGEVVSFYEFVVELAKSAELNAALGWLPSKDDIFAIVEDAEPPAYHLYASIMQKKQETLRDDKFVDGNQEAQQPSMTVNSPKEKKPVKKLFTKRKTLKKKLVASSSSSSSSSDSSESDSND